MLDFLKRLWSSGDETRGLGLFHALVEGRNAISEAEVLVVVAGIKPKMKLSTCVAQANVVKIVHGKDQLQVVDHRQSNEAFDAMDWVILISPK